MGKTKSSSKSSTSSRSSHTTRLTATKLNLIIGGLWAMYDGFMMIVGFSVMGILLGFALIVLGFLALTSTGILRLKRWVPYAWWLELIFGIVIYALGSMMPAILILIAGVAMVWLKSY